MKGPLEPPSNPFATRFVRPGAIPFRFPCGQSPQMVRRRLEETRWFGQIVGRHGSGKTTLLRTLDNYWAPWGRRPVAMTLRNGQRALPIDAGEAHKWTTSTQILVDGYEQLSWFSRCCLWWRCRRSGCGLLVTAHHDAHLPTVFRTWTSKDLARSLARELTQGRGGSFGQPCPSEDDILRAFEQSKGNLRETWFLLYDLCR